MLSPGIKKVRVACDVYQVKVAYAVAVVPWSALAAHNGEAWRDCIARLNNPRHACAGQRLAVAFDTCSAIGSVDVANFAAGGFQANYAGFAVVGE